MLTDVVSYKLAKELAKYNLYYYDPISDFYVNSDGTIQEGEYAEIEKLYKGDLIHYTEVEYVQAKLISAPTYANVLDALSIAGVNMNLYYHNGFIGLTTKKQNYSATNTSLVPEHWEDETLERGILDACELLKLYPDEYNTSEK